MTDLDSGGGARESAGRFGLSSPERTLTLCSNQRVSSASGMIRRRPRRTMRSSGMTCSSKKSMLTPSASAASALLKPRRGTDDAAVASVEARLGRVDFGGACDVARP